MERRINTQNWDMFDYYRAIRAKEKGIYQTIAWQAGLSLSKNTVGAGIGLQEKIGEMGREASRGK